MKHGGAGAEIHRQSAQRAIDPAQGAADRLTRPAANAATPWRSGVAVQLWTGSHPPFDI